MARLSALAEGGGHQAYGERHGDRGQDERQRQPSAMTGSRMEGLSGIPDQGQVLPPSEGPDLGAEVYRQSLSSSMGRAVAAVAGWLSVFKRPRRGGPLAVSRVRDPAGAL